MLRCTVPRQPRKPDTDLLNQYLEKAPPPYCAQLLPMCGCRYTHAACSLLLAQGSSGVPSVRHSATWGPRGIQLQGPQGHTLSYMDPQGHSATWAPGPFSYMGPQGTPGSQPAPVATDP
mmetsp:Transcript_38332/g.85348  ORF Transcript_38332/g.85348 Transcript_38332/m.85348 type:complete len:119 (-) Transcript_38332:914-1270(-)